MHDKLSTLRLTSNQGMVTDEPKKKVCNKCGKERGIQWFSISGNSSDGRKHLCITCANERAQKGKRKKKKEKEWFAKFSPV